MEYLPTKSIKAATVCSKKASLKMNDMGLQITCPKGYLSEMECADSQV